MVLLTHYSLSDTQARLAATRAGARVASLPGCSAELFARLILVDYAVMSRASRELAGRLTPARICRVTSCGGTGIRFALDGRAGISEDSDMSNPGAFGNLPAGEAYIAPVETSGRGRIVFDGSRSCCAQA